MLHSSLEKRHVYQTAFKKEKKRKHSLKKTTHELKLQPDGVGWGCLSLVLDKYQMTRDFVALAVCVE